MHHYPFHIGDYRSATAHLSNEEDIAYRRLIDMYFDTEQKIPLETQWVARRIRSTTEIVATVLNDFFVQHDDGWFHERCEHELAKYRQKAEQNRINGARGGRPSAKKKPSGLPVGTQTEPKKTLTKNQEPRTSNKEKQVKEKSRSRFLPPTKQQLLMYQQDAGLNFDADKFIDYYEANGWMAGRNKMKDWKAAARNWHKRQTEYSNAKNQQSDKHNSYLAELGF